jgi:uncharacterized DUF497 family protein
VSELMFFDWDQAKAASNLKKHSVSFEEAKTVFGDPFAVTIPDPDHSSAQQERLITLGMTLSLRLVVVSHTEIGDTIRIISARPATPHERKNYES